MASICFSKRSKTFYSLLGFSESDDRPPLKRWRHFLPPPDRCGLHILAAGIDYQKPHHMLESPSVGQVAIAGTDGKPYYPSAWHHREPAPIRCGIGICTEWLGCESCEIGIDDDGEGAEIGRKAAGLRSRRRTSEVQFPPPLRWMMGSGGRLCRFLKAERRDGRFVLTKVRIDQPPEMMRAFRQDGRLRLELVGTKPGGDQGPIECSEAEAERLAVPREEKSISAAGGSEEYGEEEWLMPMARIDGHRCVEVVSGEATSPLWCNHRFVTVVRSPLLGGL